MSNPASLSPTTWTGGPLDFGDPIAEARALADGAAQFGLPGRSRLILRGRDRAKFLHNFCTNEIKALSPGQGCEAFVTNVKGKILEHLFVAVEADAIALVGTVGAEDAVVAHFDRYLISEDVEIVRAAATRSQLFLAGPLAPARLVDLTAGTLDAAALAPYSHQAVDVAGASCSVQRLDLLGGHGLLVTTPAEKLSDVRAALVGAGFQAAGASVFEAARIAAGLPHYGVDLTDDNLAQEARRTDRCVSFKKGCYLGQEPIARIDAMGHVNKQLAAVRLETDVVPPRGTKVHGADGKEVGAITSAARDPLSGRVVALGILRSHAAKPGTAVTVEGDASAIRGEVFGW